MEPRESTALLQYTAQDDGTLAGLPIGPEKSR